MESGNMARPKSKTQPPYSTTPEYHKAYMTKRRAHCVRMGLCTQCLTTPARDGYTTCTECGRVAAIKGNEYAARKREEVRAMRAQLSRITT